MQTNEYEQGYPLANLFNKNKNNTDHLSELIK